MAGHEVGVSGRIDTHVHVYDFEEAARLVGLKDCAVPVPESPAPVEWLLEDMEREAISAAVLVQHSALGADNSYVVSCVDRFPDLFRAVGLVEPFDPRIDRAMAYWVDAGVVGFRFHLFYPNMEHWLESDQARLAFELAAERDVILQFHLLPSNAVALAPMLERHRAVRVIIDHLAKPDVAEPAPYESFDPVLRLAEHERCVVKIGDYEKASHLAAPWRDTWPFVELLRTHFGAERMMWGTGFPGAHRKVPLADALRYVEADLAFTDAERRQVLCETPRRLFGFP